LASAFQILAQRTWRGRGRARGGPFHDRVQL